MKQFIRKADIILFIALVLFGLAVSAALALHGGSGEGAKVVIKSGGSLYATYPLSDEQHLVIPSPKHLGTDSPAANPGDEASAQYDYYNVVDIRGGSVTVSEASCANQVCVRHGSISKPGESIVCLPNRLVVSIEGGEEGGGYDTVTS